MTCATLYLYYMIAVELSLWTEFCLFDQRNTSAAHQLTSDLNKQQTSILFSSRKSVTEERISVKYTCNLIKQCAKNRWPPKMIVLKLKEKNTGPDNIIEHFSCLKRKIRARYMLNSMYSIRSV